MPHDLVTIALGETLLRSARIVGAKWAWRLVRLVHAIPFVVGEGGSGLWGNALGRVAVGKFGEGGSGTLSRRSTARPRFPTRLPSASGDLASALAK